MIKPEKKTITAIILALSIGAFIALMGLGLSGKLPVTEFSGLTRIGKQAPDIKLRLFDGEYLTLSEHTDIGKPIVINFWASWCPPCLEEAAIIESSWQNYKKTDILFLGINIQDTDENAIKFLEKLNITYSNGSDRDGQITIDYGVTGLPVTFFVNKSGVVERRWVGAISQYTLTKWIDEIIMGVVQAEDSQSKNQNSYIKFDR